MSNKTIQSLTALALCIIGAAGFVAGAKPAMMLVVFGFWLFILTD